MPNYTNTCSCLHADYTKAEKAVEKFPKILFYGKNIQLLNRHMLKVHIGIASLGAIPMCTNSICY